MSASLEKTVWCCILVHVNVSGHQAVLAAYKVSKSTCDLVFPEMVEV